MGKYVGSFGSGGFLRKCPIFQSLEGNFGDFSPFQIQPFLDRKMTKIAFYNVKNWTFSQKAPNPDSFDISSTHI